MKWEQHSNNDGCHRLKVEADWSELVVDYNDILAEYSKVRLPGFRPGKVPRSVIEKRFKTEISKIFPKEPRNGSAARLSGNQGLSRWGL